MSARQYPSYPIYEDSGVISCPIRPNHWGVTRIKFISELNPSKSQVGHLDPITTVTFLPMEAIGENGELDVSRERSLQDVKNGYTFLGEGDVCIAKITPCFENGKGAVILGTLNGVAFATTEVIPFRCKLSEDARFLYYLLTSEPFKADAEASMYGAGGQKRVADSFAGNYPVVLPPSVERFQIANFLDYETAKIDALIAKQQELVALLKEKRQAVISHAVTKGLNPNAPMRDSGVEWLGEVPAHWRPSKAGRLCSVISKGTTPVQGFIGEHGVPFVRVNNLTFDGSISLEELVFVSETTHRIELGRSKVYPGDVLMNIVGPPLGKVSVVGDDYNEYNLNQAVAFFRVHDVESSFLAAWLQTSFARDWFWLRAKKTSGQANLTLEHCYNLPVAVPLPKEQREIIATLRKRVANLDRTLNLVLEQLDLLQERRTALISAAVTGKIDVRGWQHPESKV